MVVANNVLAHVPDINDFLLGIASILKPNGFASIECPHLLKLLTGNQFDTIYHEHYSYLSLHVIARIADMAHLKVIDVQEIATHGGSLRVWLASKSSSSQPTKNVSAILFAEHAAGLETLPAWDHFQNAAERSKIFFIAFSD